MSANLRLSANGRICIPADVRQQLGLKDGDTLSLTVTDDALVLRTVRQRVRATQAAVRKLMKGKPRFTVDDFLRERRANWEPDAASDDAPPDGR
jgi:AbrB family transcriptional regulator, stage V sporulation protein T